jgi:hypothetical protein
MFDQKNRNVFIYWVGKEYKLIKILRDLMYLHSKNGEGYKLHFLTDKNINEYIKNIPEYFNKLIPAHQADFVRVHVICEYGGIWLDSDTLVLDSLDSLFNILDEKDGFLLKHYTLGNGVFGSNKQTEFMKTWKKLLLLKVSKEKQKMKWADVGSIMLEKLYKENIDLFKNYKIFNAQDSLYPVKYYNCVTEYLKKPFNNYKNIIREYQPLIVLVNSVYKELEKETMEDILNGKKPINYFINKSFDNFNNKSVKILICGFPHCGTSILKSIIGHSKNVEEIKYECDKIYKTSDKDFILCKSPRTKPYYFDKQYNDYIKIFIIRNPLFVYSSLNKRYNYEIPSENNFNEYVKTLKLFIKYKNNPEKNIYVIRYEDLFPNNYSKLKEILNNIGIKYTDKIFNNSEYINVAIKNASLPKKKPKNTDHSAYRTWQINQPFVSNNDISKIDVNDIQKNEIINNTDVLQIYPNIKSLF